MLLKAVQAGALSFLYAAFIQIMCMWATCFRCDLFIHMQFVYTW